MRKSLLLLFTGLILLCVIAAAGCTSTSDSTSYSYSTTTTTTIDADGNVHTETHTITTCDGQTNVSSSSANYNTHVLGDWFGDFVEMDNRYVVLTVNDDGTAQANFYEIVENGSSKLLQTTNATFTLTEDGTYKLTDKDSSEISYFKLSDDGKTLASVLVSGVDDIKYLRTFYKNPADIGLVVKSE